MILGTCTLTALLLGTVLASCFQSLSLTMLADFSPQKGTDHLHRVLIHVTFLPLQTKRELTFTQEGILAIYGHSHYLNHNKKQILQLLNTSTQLKDIFSQTGAMSYS